MKRVHVGYSRFCGHCRNPFGIVQTGGHIEVGAPRRFGQKKPAPRPRALCPGFASGAHHVWRLQ